MTDEKLPPIVNPADDVPGYDPDLERPRTDPLLERVEGMQGQPDEADNTSSEPVTPSQARNADVARIDALTAAVKDAFRHRRARD